jgi:hypothetical protein
MTAAANCAASCSTAAMTASATTAPTMLRSERGGLGESSQP